jgi:PAS domain-containing protein
MSHEVDARLTLFRLRATLNGIGDAVIVTDLESRITF